jgi:hypothetical protein
LKQRVALRCALGTLSAAETAAYIAGRVRIAGGEASIMFTREAIEEVHRGSGGIPRTITVICDNALVSGFAVGIKPITADVIREVCADFDLNRRTAVQAPAPPPPAVIPGPIATAVAPVVQQRPPAQPQPTPVPDDGTDRGLFGSYTKKRRFSFF